MSDSSQTQLLSPGASPLALTTRELVLEVVEGPDLGRIFGPLVPPVRVGSAAGNEVGLSDPAVSRVHCTIDRGGDGLEVADASSTNGTFLGPYRVRVASLSEGASLRVGQTVLAVRVSAKAQVVPISLRNRFGALFADSPLMRALFATLARLAPATAPVLVEGETGTGKELVGRALHSEGPRKDAPFIVVDCGAVAPTLIESELFGHTRGAFTGAEQARPGAFELAGSGTVFLDEVGELPLSLQPKLLRVLEGGTVKPLGGAKELRAMARVVAATHRDLRRMVNEGTFREDLYFRLAVFPVFVPPLRDRPDDITLLGQQFFASSLAAAGLLVGATAMLSRETLSMLHAQTWPGNVRELRNAVERAVILGDHADVLRGDLTKMLRGGDTLGRHAGPPVGLEEAKRRFEREYLVRLLAKHEGDVRNAAAEADLHPKSLERLIRRHDLRRG